MGDTDPSSHAATRWLAAGLLDLPFYAALRGREFADAEEAARDFVDHGMRRRLSPHPFLDFVSLPPEVRRAWRRGRVDPVLDHLTDDQGVTRPVGPLADRVDDPVVRAGMLDLAQLLGREAGDGADEEPPPVDWDAMSRVERRPGRISFVVVASAVKPTVRVADELRREAEAEGVDVELVVVDHGTPPHVALGLHASLCGRARGELLRVPATLRAAAATDLGIARSTGGVLALLEPQVFPRRGALSPLLSAIADPEVAGVQPLVLGADDLIDSAGLAADPEAATPARLLAGHPKEDARRLAGQPLDAIGPEVMVVRARDAIAVGGLGSRAAATEAQLDLCARLRRRCPGGFRVVPTALFSSSRDPERGVTERAGPPHVRAAVARPEGEASSQRLRWSLNLPSPPGSRGDRWGDTHFADALAAALRDLGQDVVTRRRGAHEAGPTHLDDVSLALRGLHPIPPVPGRTNVLWVISHPDDVDPAELEGFDLVCAASPAWSAEMSERAGREVVPLLQATEFRAPAAADSGTESSVVFVGSTRPGRDRPLVRKAVEAGVPLAVYGRGWESLPTGTWRGEYVDNDRLPELYHRHGIVLADHWPDMARHGFIANRVFDAVAAGARVVSDDVRGLHEVFDPRDVAVAHTPEDVAAAVAAMRQAPSEEHPPRPSLSFLDRARTLLDLVTGS